MEDFLSQFEKDGKIKVGLRVQGKFGPLVANPKAALVKKNRCIRSDAICIVVRAVDEKKLLIKRNQDAELIGACSCILKVVDKMTGVPVDELTK